MMRRKNCGISMVKAEAVSIITATEKKRFRYGFK